MWDHSFVSPLDISNGCWRSELRDSLMAFAIHVEKGCKVGENGNVYENENSLYIVVEKQKSRPWICFLVKE